MLKLLINNNFFSFNHLAYNKFSLKVSKTLLFNISLQPVQSVAIFK